MSDYSTSMGEGCARTPSAARDTARHAARPAYRNRSRGAILVEFSFIAILMYLLMAIVVDFGRLFYSHQVAQDAARTAARELGTIPLPADMTLTQALADPAVQARVFQPQHLVVDLDNIPGGLDLNTFFDSLPVLNQMLRPLMIFQQVEGKRLVRYPGTLLVDGNTPSGYTVGVPFVVSRGQNGVETIRWVPVIEEIRNFNFPDESPFAQNTPEAMPQRGLVAIRINMPYQAAMLSAYTASTPGEPNIGNPILADDGSVTQLNAAPGGLTAGAGVGPYGGPLGLGSFYAQNSAVRPFSKLLTAQAIFRREVFD